MRMLKLSPPVYLRFSGLLPLVFFGLKLQQYTAEGKPEQIFWFCNISNLLLAVALLARRGEGVFISTVLLLTGIPVWVLDFLVHQDFHFVSLLTHVVSPTIGVAALFSLTWSRAAIVAVPVYYIVLQLAARFFTDPETNINVAFEVYAPVRGLFSNFWIYSALNLAGLTLAAFMADRILRRARDRKDLISG